MVAMESCKDSSWWVVALPAVLGSDKFFCDGGFVLLAVALSLLSAVILTWALNSGGPAWAGRRRGAAAIPGPRGLPVLGSLLMLSRKNSLPHRALANLAKAHNATKLMAFSIGITPAVVSSDPTISKELLSHPNLADRPLKQSARELMFGRAIGFAPNGSYWRLLRRIASSHLFAPRRIAAHSAHRSADCAAMVAGISREQRVCGSVQLRAHLLSASLNNIMGSVFGRRYDVSRSNNEAEQVKNMVREGFDLLGAFNWSDHLPWLTVVYDPSNVARRCAVLVPRVRRFVKSIIDDHKRTLGGGDGENSRLVDNADFVDVLLSLDDEEKLNEDDMIAVLWEMIFRGTDTVALLTEWAMAELVLNPAIQTRLRSELDSVVGSDRVPTDTDVAKLPYLNAVIKETLRAHPPGPLLSWARLSTADVQLSNGLLVPAGTTVMVNMWAITHDPEVWDQPEKFNPDRFMPGGAAADLDVRGGDLRLSPFGAGRRVCPGKSLGYSTAALWLARLVHGFEWTSADGSPVLLDEVLKLSCEMKSPLKAVAVRRENVAAF